MRRFTQLFHDVDESGRTGDKQIRLETYIREAPPADAAWAVWFLWGNRLRTGISPRRLKQWALEVSACPGWLAETCQSVVGDLGETTALLLPTDGRGTDLALSELVEQHLQPLSMWEDRFQFHLYRQFSGRLNPSQALVVHKMLTGTLRIGISRRLLVRALASVLEADPAAVATRLSGEWVPDEDFFSSIGRPDSRWLTVPPDPALTDLLQDLEDDPGTGHPVPCRHRARLVLVYARAGRGAGQLGFSELTLAAREGEEFVAVARTGTGLDPAEARALGQWIQENTLARRGPVRTVPPEMVFEVGYERLRPSGRHKSGLIMRFPRILTWLRQSEPAEADSLDSLRRRLDS